MSINVLPASRSPFKGVAIDVEATQTGLVISGRLQFRENVYLVEHAAVDTPYPGEPVSYKVVLSADGELALVERRHAEAHDEPEDVIFMLIEFTLLSETDTPATVPIYVSNVVLMPDSRYLAESVVEHRVSSEIRVAVSQERLSERNRRQLRNNIKAKINTSGFNGLSKAEQDAVIQIILKDTLT